MMKRDRDAEEKIQSLLEEVRKDDVILSGSRRALLDEIVPRILDPEKRRNGGKKKANLARLEQLAVCTRRPKSAGDLVEQKKGGLSPDKERKLVDRLSQPKKSTKQADQPVVYLHGHGQWSQPSGGRFSTAKPKTWVEWKVYMSREIPGPATYANSAFQVQLPKGGRFNEARPPSTLDQIIMQKRDLPGPGGSGNLSSALNQSGVGKIQMSRGKTALDWQVHHAKDLPGPGQYKVSDSLFQKDGGRFGKHKPKSELDLVVMRAKEIPGPLDYYAERSYKNLGCSSPK